MEARSASKSPGRCCRDFWLDKTQWTNSSTWHDREATVCSDVCSWWVLMHWQLQFSPYDVFFIDFSWPSSQGCSHPCCLSTFSCRLVPSSLLSLNMLQYSTLWAASDLLVEGVNIIFWTTFQSTVFSMTVVAWTELDQEIHNIYTVFILIYPKSKWNIEIWDLW